MKDYDFNVKNVTFKKDDTRDTVIVEIVRYTKIKILEMGTTNFL